MLAEAANSGVDSCRMMVIGMRGRARILTE